MANRFRAAVPLTDDWRPAAGLLIITDDHAEFHAAFDEGRPPRWTGQ